MDIDKVKAVFFSPTGTSKKIVKSIAEGLNAKETVFIDVTKRKEREEISFDNEVVIIAAPVYYGRLPVEIAPFLKTIKGNNNPAVLIAVYGNREFDDALVELYDISKECNLVPAACGAFIAEHSYSPLYPIADGRPDASDIKKAKELGKIAAEKIKNGDQLELDADKVPGNRPYIVPVNLENMKEAKKKVPMTPETDMELCIDCKMCVDSCPNGAIDEEDVTVIDRWNCMLCFACIKICPQDAKFFKPAPFDEAIKGLSEKCKERKEPAWFV